MIDFSPNIKVEIITISSRDKGSTKAVKITIQRNNHRQPEVFLVDLGQVINKLVQSDAPKHLGEYDDIFTSLYHKLTDREQQVITLVALGGSSIEIAEKLFVSPNTVKNHRRNVKKKLELYEPIKYSKFLSWVVLNRSSSRKV